jgi:hypothetical protein
VVLGLNQLVHDVLSQISLAQLTAGDVASLTRITRLGHPKAAGGAPAAGNVAAG